MADCGFAVDWPSPAGVRAWQTTRQGGVSRGAYDSLNLARHVGDAPAAVTENRKRLLSALSLPSEPAWLEQVHESRVLRLDRGDSGPADAAVTFNVATPLVVMTADCLPVLLAATDAAGAGIGIGVAHAGWRGLAAGVIEAAVAALECDPNRVMAWLGPAIGQSAFEVQDEVRNAFLAGDAAAENAFDRNPRGRWQADLYALARAALKRAGVARVFGRVRCTFSDAERYFSHRRQAPCGRMASLIWREGQLL